MNALDVFGSFGRAVELTEGENTGCSLVTEIRHVALSPKYIGRLRTGVTELLDAKLGRFSESLRGVLLAYGNMKLLHSSGVIVDDNPFIHFDVKLDAVVFKPKIGKMLKCVVNEQAADHVGCLVHGWFNLSLLATSDDLANGRRPLRLAPGSTLLVQVQRLHSRNGVLAIEAQAPDDGSDLILEMAAGGDGDDETNEGSSQQSVGGDNPDGHEVSTAEASPERKSKKKKKKKKKEKEKEEEKEEEMEKTGADLEQEEESDSPQLSSCREEPSGQTRAGTETSSPKKAKKRKRKESAPPARDAATTAGEETTEPGQTLEPMESDHLDSTQLAAGEETNPFKKKKKKKKKKRKAEPEEEASDGESEPVEACEETSPKKKKKKKKAKERDPDACVDSFQPPNGPAFTEAEDIDESPRAEGVVSLQSPLSPSGDGFTKLKRKKRHGGEESGTPLVSALQPLISDPSSPTAERTPGKKRKHGTQPENAASGECDATFEGHTPGDGRERESEPGEESTPVVGRKAHKKQKRKGADGDAADNALNGSSKKKKKKLKQET